MTWEQVRTNYPDQWIIMEALQASTYGGKRVFDQVGVLDACAENDDLFPRYKKLRAEFPGKEIIFYHSAHESLDIEVKSWHGARLPR